MHANEHVVTQHTMPIRAGEEQPTKEAVCNSEDDSDIDGVALHLENLLDQAQTAALDAEDSSHDVGDEPLQEKGLVLKKIEAILAELHEIKLALLSIRYSMQQDSTGKAAARNRSSVWSWSLIPD